MSTRLLRQPVTYRTPTSTAAVTAERIATSWDMLGDETDLYVRNKLDTDDYVWVTMINNEPILHHACPRCEMVDPDCPICEGIGWLDDSHVPETGTAPSVDWWVPFHDPTITPDRVDAFARAIEGAPIGIIHVDQFGLVPIDPIPMVTTREQRSMDWWLAWGFIRCGYWPSLCLNVPADDPYLGSYIARARGIAKEIVG